MAIFNVGKLKGERRNISERLTFFMQIFEVLGRGSFTGKIDARRNPSNQPFFALRHFMQQSMSSLFSEGVKRIPVGDRDHADNIFIIVNCESTFVKCICLTFHCERESSVYSQRALHWP